MPLRKQLDKGFGRQARTSYALLVDEDRSRDAYSVKVEWCLDN